MHNFTDGIAIGASFVCSVHDVCERITVVDNYVKRSTDPWHCKFVHTYEVGRNNTGQAALSKCMEESMPRELESWTSRSART